MNAADTIREAAKVLRERAEADRVPAGPWRPGESVAMTQYDERSWGGKRQWSVGSDRGADRLGLSVAVMQGRPSENTARYIATMHPGVALALADWLDDEAERIPPHATHAMTSGGMEIGIDAAPSVRVARQILGGDA